MPRKQIKKTCNWCHKNFLTYDQEMDFCNTEHKGKYEYAKKYYIKQPNEKENYCLECGEKSPLKWCTEQCKRSYVNKERRQETCKNNKETFLNKNKRRLIPYSVLNKIEEKKRVFEDSWWNYNKNHDRI